VSSAHTKQWQSSGAAAHSAERMRWTAEQRRKAEALDITLYDRPKPPVRGAVAGPDGPQLVSGGVGWMEGYSSDSPGWRCVAAGSEVNLC